MKALDLQAKAKLKREKEEREMEKLREKERIRMGKELNEVARIEADQKMKRLADERRLDREEEARAREKIRVKLEEDRCAMDVVISCPLFDRFGKPGSIRSRVLGFRTAGKSITHRSARVCAIDAPRDT